MFCGFQIILLSVVALAFATPIDDKAVNKNTNPDISTLPLKKDDPKVDSVKIESAHHQDGGVHAYPLHKRETPNAPRVGEQPITPPSGVKAQAPAPVAQKNNQQQPIYNRPAVNSDNQKQHQSSTNLNNHKHQPQPSSNLNNNNSQKNQQSNLPASNINGQKSQPAVSQQAPQPARPLSQINGQALPISSQSARVRRETPKAVDLKATPQAATANLQKKPAVSQVNSQPKQAQSPKVTRDTPKTPQAATSNLQQKPAVAPVNTQQKSPQTVQRSRVTREAPKSVDPKATPQAATNSQKTPAAPVTQQKPKVVRETPKAVDQKATPQAASNSQKKPAVTPVALASQPKQRVVREAPKPDQKPAQSLNAQKPHADVASLPKTPLTPSAKSRPVRENNQAKTDSNPSVIAKVPLKSSEPSSSATSQNKNSQTQQNIQPYSSSDNQSPQFIHPVPVDQILKKPATSEQHHSADHQQSGTSAVGA